jgi:hypothetical protein
MKKVSSLIRHHNRHSRFLTLQCETYTPPSASVRQTFGNVVDANAGGKTGPIQISVTGYIYPIVANWVPCVSYLYSIKHDPLTIQHMAQFGLHREGHAGW